MNPQLPWRVAIRIAWREMRASRSRFLFVVLAVAIGVGSLTGVRSFGSAFRHMLLREARTLMAGDMSLRVFAMPTSEQDAVLQDLARRGAATHLDHRDGHHGLIGGGRRPGAHLRQSGGPRGLSVITATVKLDPPQPLRRALNAHTVVVSDDVLVRLKVRTGDTLHLGGQDFRIAGVVTSEPDRMTGSLNVGPRVMITRDGLERTGLISLGSRAAERYLFRLPATGPPGVGEVRQILKDNFPEATIADYTETHPIITRGLDRATTFLSLIGLIALVIGAMGVGSAMHGHLQQKLDSIAVMKCIGARSAQVIRIYTAQTLMLGLSGGILGALLGIAVASAFPGLIAKYFSIQGVGRLGCLARGAGRGDRLPGHAPVHPAAAHRDPRHPSRRSVPPGCVREPAGHAACNGRSWRCALLILLGTGAVAGTLSEGNFHDALRTGGIFAAGLAVGLALLSAAAWLALRGVRAALRHAPAALPGMLRHGIANLYRPGNQAQSAVVALGVGVMFTLTVFLVQNALVRQIRGSAPPGMPNVFLLDIPGSQRQTVADFIATQPGVTAAPDVAQAVAARIAAIDGVPVEQLPLRAFGRRFLRTRSVTEMESKPPETQILSGAWWRPGDRDPQACVTEEAARILHLKTGSVIDWDIWKRPVRTRVACIQRTESIRMSARFEFIFSPGQLTGLPAVYYGSARVRPPDVPSLQRVMYQRFPTVTVVNMADVMQIVEDVVDRIALVIRFISAFTILAGAVMVASSIAGTRFRRMREVVILKTLGATRSRIAWIFSVEFLALGAIAGAMGTLLASGFAALVLKQLLDIEFHPDALSSGMTIALTALVATAAGWAASFRILGRKPLEILRGE